MSKPLPHRPFRYVATLLTAALIVSFGASAKESAGVAAGYYESAVRLLEKGDYRGAIIELRNALQADPKDLASRVLLGRTYLNFGIGAMAEKELRRARRDGAQDEFVLVAIGRALVLQGHYRKALDELSAAGQSAEIAAKIAVIRGDAHLALREYRQAEENYLEASRIEPNNAVPLIGMANVKRATDDLPGAERYVQWALAADPDNPEVWYARGEIARLERNVDEALKHYDKAVALSPYFVRALLARAGMLIDKGELDKAEPDILEIRKVDPRNPEAAYLHALLLTRRGKVKEAQDALVEAENILKSYSAEVIRSHPPTMLLLGLVSYFRKDHDAAYRHLSNYLKHVPHHLGARKILASVALSSGDAAHAVHLLEKAVPHMADDVDVLTMYGDALMRIRRHREAAKVLEQAAAIARPGSSALSRLVALQINAGRDDAAVKILKSEMERDPDAIRAAITLTSIYWRNGEFEEALKLIDSVVEREPDNPVALNLAGGTRLSLEDLDGARTSFEAAIRADPDHLPAVANLAKLEARLGNLDKAIALFQTVLQKDPKSTAALLALADIERQRGDIEAAIRWLEKARSGSRRPRVAALRLVDLYIMAKQPDRALSVSRQLSAGDPANLVHLLALGRAQLASKHVDDAGETFREIAARAKDLKSPDWLQQAAVWQMRALDKQGALDSLESALAIDGGHLPSHQELIKLDFASGSFDRAMARAKRISAQEPDSPVGYGLQGDVYMHMRRFESAVHAYDSALRKGDSANVAIRLYEARRAAGKGALDFAERWAEKHAGDGTAQRLLASAYLHAGRSDEAMTIYRRLLETAPKDTTSLNNVALIYQAKGDPRALDYARRAYDAEPTHPATIDTYGWILVQRGDAEGGLKFLRNAKLRAPLVPEIRYHLAVALNALGKPDEAKQELKAALHFGHRFEGIAEARALLAELTGRRR